MSIAAATLLRGGLGLGVQSSAEQPVDAYAGSATCRQCHEQFYELWASSHHGLGMQPYTKVFATEHLTPQEERIEIGVAKYRASIDAEEGQVYESGPTGDKAYPIVHVMGGKNVYYFLTPMAKGRLQVLPLAYDVDKKRWFDTAASGVRHFPGNAGDAPLHWTDPSYTFNTSCYSCHVSQIAKNYDLKTDSYHTTWTEPGINCEACHGPGQTHVNVCQSAQTGEAVKDLQIISTKSFSVEQTNTMCNSCHAKMNPVSVSFKPGDRYFDHFDLVTLEHTDFYPDGRDLGENYTMTGWLMNPCAQAGKLTCTHCHTSSGRYRFRNAEQPNAACLSCHSQKVENVTEHTHHDADSAGSLCVACHMPTTRFARMTRSDHSMRPPAPAATLKFKSPNACNICHEDKDAAWAGDYVRKWYKEDYQRSILEQASLVDEARRGYWDRLWAILTYIGSKGRNEVVAASLLRLLANCQSQAKWPTVIEALQEDASPLVRAAAAQTLDGYITAESLGALAKATSDEFRLVRVRAAGALSTIRIGQIPGEYQTSVNRATTELLEGLGARPDDYASHYNLGNFYMGRGDQERALASYQTAIKLRPDFVPPHVNLAFVYNAKGQNDKAEASLRNAIALDPNNPVFHLNLGMLLGEMNRPRDAAQAFRRTLEIDPNSVVAAYNLGVILAADQPTESLRWCRKAYELHPEEGKYGYTYAFYLYQRRETKEAVRVLQEMVRRNVPSGHGYVLLGAIYLEQGRPQEAAAVYRSASENPRLTQTERESFRAVLRSLE